MTKRRRSTVDVTKRALTEAATVAEGKAPPAAPRAPGALVMTGLYLPAELLNLLRLVAVKRAERGGRVSVSAVIASLVRRARADLERELDEL